MYAIKNTNIIASIANNQPYVNSSIFCGNYINTCNLIIRKNKNQNTFIRNFCGKNNIHTNFGFNTTLIIKINYAIKPKILIVGYAKEKEKDAKPAKDAKPEKKESKEKKDDVKDAKEKDKQKPVIDTKSKQSKSDQSLFINMLLIT